VKGTQAIIERAPDREAIKRRVPSAAPVQMDSAFSDEPEIEEEIIEEETLVEDESGSGNVTEVASTEDSDDSEKRDGGRGKRRRGGRRGGKRENGDAAVQSAEASSDSESAEESAESSVVDDRPAASDDAGIETEASTERAEGPDANGGRSRERGGRKRGRFGRDRGPRRERSSETNDETSAEATPRFEPVAAAATPAPQPVLISISEFVPPPEPRKWQPPAPTVTAETVERKGGWWSKRK